MKKILLGVLVVLILIQFITPQKNNSKDYTKDITTELQIPNDVLQIIKTSCADCHSNSTVYPWYNKIAPFSWYLAQHVNEGKEHLNFSEWTKYNNDQKNHIVKGLKEVIKKREMPLTTYVLIHKNAAMDESQYILFLNWINTIKKY